MFCFLGGTRGGDAKGCYKDKREFTTICCRPLLKASCLPWCDLIKWGTKTLTITFQFLAPDDLQMLCLSYRTHKDAISTRPARLRATHQHARSILDGFVESRCQPKSRQHWCWWVVKCSPQGGTARTTSSSDSHKRPCIFMTATPNPNNKQWRGQAGTSAERFISPLVTIESYSPRQALSHNRQGGPFTDEDSAIT